MTDKLYIVHCSQGDWDDYTHWIAGYFTNPKDAEDLKDKLNSQAGMIQAASPFPNDDGLEMDSDDYIKYWDYRLKNEVAMEWKGAEVIEVVMNKQIFEFKESTWKGIN